MKFWAARMTKTEPSPSSLENFEKLSQEIRRLGNALGTVISKIEGAPVLEMEEQIRRLAKANRAGDPEADQKLREAIRALDTHEAYEMVMAFTTYFELVNLAEENFRIALLRSRRHQSTINAAPPQRESIEAAVQELKNQGVSSEEMQLLVNQLSIELVFTAHPTEAKRRTMLTKLRRLAQILRGESPDSRGTTQEQIEREIASLWLTDRCRTNRPEVTDEVRTGLWYFDTTLWETLPELQADFERALARHYPEVKPSRRWLTFGSWIGGDRDGNPNVTAQITAETLMLHRRLALDKFRQSALEVSRLLTVSDRRDRVSPALTAWLKQNHQLSHTVADRYPNEPYRLMLATLRTQLQEAYDALDPNLLLKGLPEGAPRPLSADHIDEALDIMTRSLKQGRSASLAAGELSALRQQVEVFGLNVASLDVRQHSSRHEEAIADVLQALGKKSGYAALSEDEKVDVLTAALAKASPDELEKATTLQPATLDVIQPLQVVGRARDLYGTDSVGIYIISMTDALSDVLEALLLMKWSGVRLDIAPLFETLDDLQRAPLILESMFVHPEYREHLELRDRRQTVMLGYSDSNKDCGYITANWALFLSQETVVKKCREHHIALSLFHGRGGSIARGGGPAAKAILAQPAGLYDGGIRITEQGEVLSTRYHDPDLAHRILEQVTYGVLLGSAAARRESVIPEAWRTAMEKMSQTGFEAYKSLVHDDPDFIAFWKAATPIDEISSLKLGSRPAFRKQTKSVEDLRAIPWVFSWMQSRFAFPGWFGLGSALESVIAEGPAGIDLLRAMYQEWPFFQTTIDNAQLTISKADLKIAALYSTLVKDEAVRARIFAIIESEFKRTIDAILMVTGQKVLLEREKVLQRSVQLRNPYIDPLNYIQVEMIRRLRSQRNMSGSDDEALRAVIELAINGVSGGLKNTG